MSAGKAHYAACEACGKTDKHHRFCPLILAEKRAWFEWRYR